MRRDGVDVEVDTATLVVGDLLEVARGDQLPVDGVVVSSAGLEMDESLLTGEADPVSREPGDRVLSGSFVVSGDGRVLVTAVGDDAYAAGLAAEARRFTAVRSELREGTDLILRVGTWALVPTAALLVVSQVRSTSSLDVALRSSIAGVAAMIPEGLVLLTSIAFAVGVVRLGRRRALVQELAAVEVLARVDVVCVDKTGTLTEGALRVASVSFVDTDADSATHDITGALGALSRVEPNPNSTISAIADHLEDPSWTATELVPFSSARKWSGATFDGRGTWVLGAPEMLLPAGDPLGARVAALADAGNRVVLLARSSGLVEDGIPEATPVALVALEERIRPEAAPTLAYFAREGVAVKVISGDHPRTAAAVAGAVGMPDVGDGVDARTLPADPDALADALDGATVFGRVQPRQKRAMVEALQAHGHVVAMTGDGVNDVLALKQADLGVAMGSGSPASRAVAQVVLLDDSFASLPSVLGEGRRVIANIERVARLFITKSVYAFMLAIAVGIVNMPFPFYPRHLTIISSLTIGIPAFFLALAPNAQRHRPGFVGRVARFAVPTGVVAATATFAAYAAAAEMVDSDIVEERTTALLVLFTVAMWVLVTLSRPLTPARTALILAMVAAFVTVFASPRLRAFFEVRLPPAPVLIVAAVIAAVAVVSIEIESRVTFGPGRSPSPSVPST